MITITVSPIVAAAIGHAMCFAVEEDTDPDSFVLVDEELRTAAAEFYEQAKRLAAIHRNETA